MLVSLLSKEVGVSKSAVHHWVKAYQERGEAGLRDKVGSSGSRRKLSGPVRRQRVQTTPQTEFEDGSAADITLNRKVEVEGVVNEAFILIAEKVEFE